jgi:hypothetical protein
MLQYLGRWPTLDDVACMRKETTQTKGEYHLSYKRVRLGTIRDLSFGGGTTGEGFVFIPAGNNG